MKSGDKLTKILNAVVYVVVFLIPFGILIALWMNKEKIKALLKDKFK